MVNALVKSCNAQFAKEQKALHAAEYVRMSTDHQRYSTANQRQVIAAYAAERNIDIVRTYTDDGRSGLTIIGRGGLQELIADVQFARTNFNCILVYDISRWGRFQNVDESAYYEFICTRAGVKVHYCADEFENDGSLASAMLKVAKRFAAADFSRGLSKRVFIGQCRITELGFWRGGAPAFGLRRELLNDQGLSRGLMEAGQQKALQTDRTILRPGPISETKVVRRIFRMLVSQRKEFKEIATELNADQLKTARGNPWAGQTVLKVLTNEAYIGNIVFNRMSYKLKQKPTKNPSNMWVRRNGALAPIVAPDLFAKAQEIIAERRRRVTNEEVLGRLAALRVRKGHLSSNLISEASGVLNPTTLIKRFGSLTAAYTAVDFQPASRYRWRETEQRIRSLIDAAIPEIVAQLIEGGFKATFDTNARALTIGDKGTWLTIGSARCLSEGPIRRWRVRVDRSATTLLTLICRMNETNTSLQDYFLLPTADIARTRVKKLRITSRVFSKCSRMETVSEIANALKATQGHLQL